MGRLGAVGGPLVVLVPDVAVPDVAVPEVAVPDVAVPDVAVPVVVVPLEFPLPPPPPHPARAINAVKPRPIVAAKLARRAKRLCLRDKIMSFPSPPKFFVTYLMLVRSF